MGKFAEPWAGSKSLRIARSIPVSIQVLCDMSARGVIAHSVDAFVDEPVGPVCNRWFAGDEFSAAVVPRPSCFANGSQYWPSRGSALLAVLYHRRSDISWIIEIHASALSVSREIPLRIAGSPSKEHSSRGWDHKLLSESGRPLQCLPARRQ